MDFIIIANTWNAGRDNPTSKHRIAIELVRRGHKVLWIEGSGMRTPSVGSSSDRLRMVRKVLASLRGVRREEVRIQDSGFSIHSHISHLTSYPSQTLPSLHILSPLFVPLPRYELVRWLNGLICRISMRFWGWRLGFHDPVLINYVPVLAEAMRGGRGRPQTTDYRPQTLDQRTPCEAALSSFKSSVYGLKSKVSPCAPRVVYHCVDRWDAFAMYDSAMMAKMDRRCCELADVVIASSRDLVERCRRYNPNVQLVSHGVDHDHFSRALQISPRPADLPSGRVAGFFGLLSEWLDQDLLIEVARRVPECEVVLIGKADVTVERLKGLRNVHLLGPRPFSQLPGYVAHFDVGLIPFVINDLTVAVNPIKLREMLSAGCPVVSTDLPEVQAFKGRGLVVASTVESFSEAVAAQIRNPATLEERLEISNGVANETWSAKVDEILGVLKR